MITSNHRYSSVISNDHQWSVVITSDHQWSPGISGDRQWLSVLIDDHHIHQWSSMITSGHQWWSPVIISDQWWSPVISGDHQWSPMIISDQWWSPVIISDHQWSSLISGDYQWSSVIISDHQWSPVISGLQMKSRSNECRPSLQLLYSISSSCYSSSDDWNLKHKRINSEHIIISCLLSIGNELRVVQAGGSCWVHANDFSTILACVMKKWGRSCLSVWWMLLGQY